MQVTLSPLKTSLVLYFDLMSYDLGFMLTICFIVGTMSPKYNFYCVDSALNFKMYHMYQILQLKIKPSLCEMAVYLTHVKGYLSIKDAHLSYPNNMFRFEELYYLS